MKLVIFGLSVTSSWGNGHATLLRGLFRSLHQLGHEVHFFEKDTPYYAAHRDICTFSSFTLHLYSDWELVFEQAKRELADADVGMVTSYCQNGREASDLILETDLWRRIFYDMDTPVTLSQMEKGVEVDYVPIGGLAGFDIVLSYTGGLALEQLRSKLGARRAAALYGWVDPDIYHRVPAVSQFESQLSYLGTYAADRQQALEELFIKPAEVLTDCQFLIGGTMYPDTQGWSKNIRFIDHVAPPQHCAFYSSSPLTLNVTRGSMASMGYCPSGRLFEAAACGTALISDRWEGLERFFTPDEEIFLVDSCQVAVQTIKRDPEELSRVGSRARERALSCHTAEIRAKRMLELIDGLMDESLNATDSMVLAAEQA